MPPLAVQRSDSRPSTDHYSNPNSNSFSRPSYPQPYINGTSSQPNGMPGAGGALVRSRSEFGNEQASTQSFSGDYNLSHQLRAPIDYPRLPNPPPLPPLARPAYPAVPPVPTRPAPVQPAPIRSNSSLGNLSLAPYQSASSALAARNSRFAGGNASWGGIGGEEMIGLTGLKNLGNTCYMNSTIQCLSATIPFARYFIGQNLNLSKKNIADFEFLTDNTFMNDINYTNALGTKGKLALAVSDLIRSLWKENYNFLSPVTFREQICLVAPQFRGGDQHDAQEFLGFLLDGLHEDLNYVLVKPKIVEMTKEREKDLEEVPQQIMSVREWDLWRLRGDSFVAQGFQGQFRNMMKCLTCGQVSQSTFSFRSSYC